MQNDPVNLRDLWGLCSASDIEVAKAALVGILPAVGEITSAIPGWVDDLFGVIIIAAVVGKAVYENHQDADNTTPLVTPPINPNGGKGPQHGNDDHDEAIDDRIDEIKEQGGSNIRKNQDQVDANGNKVGNNRPDIQWDDAQGNHHVEEFDHIEKNSIRHGEIITTNDPNAIVDLILLP